MQTEPKPQLEIPERIEGRILKHYEIVAPLLERHFAGTPLEFANYPHGLKKKPHWHRIGVPLSASKMLWCVHKWRAVEFYSWVPLPEDLTRLRFGRILLEHPPSLERLKIGALAIRALLFEHGLEAVLLHDGGTGIAIWVPFADAPHAVPLRVWLHKLCNEAVAKHPDLFTNEYNTHELHRVHLHVTSNAPQCGSILPYCPRGEPALPIATPLEWHELGDFRVPLHVGEIEARLKTKGDVFGEQLVRIKPQYFKELQVQPVIMKVMEPWGRALNAAFAILEDGKALSAQEILDAALARELVPPSTSKKYVYTALIEYIARTIGHGRTPVIVQDPDRRFRINEPSDDWPDLEPLPPAPPLNAQTEELIARVESTSHSLKDPAAFESAVCDSFAHLGFLATHLGGHDAPDGYADAPLGPLGYRLMLECKSAKDAVAKPDCVEASKFRAAYSGDLCAIIGPDFSNQEELVTELRTHNVTAITTSDLRTLLSIGATPLEVKAILRPGFAADYLSDLLWERRHGARKRLATIAHILKGEGWKAQCTAAQQGGANTAPRLTADAAMLLVDEALQAYGTKRACTRDEVQAAFTHLTDPLIASAVWSDPLRDSIVITAGISVFSSH